MPEEPGGPNLGDMYVDVGADEGELVGESVELTPIAQSSAITAMRREHEFNVARSLIVRFLCSVLSFCVLECSVGVSEFRSLHI